MKLPATTLAIFYTVSLNLLSGSMALASKGQMEPIYDETTQKRLAGSVQKGEALKSAARRHRQRTSSRARSVQKASSATRSKLESKTESEKDLVAVSANNDSRKATALEMASWKQQNDQRRFDMLKQALAIRRQQFKIWTFKSAYKKAFGQEGVISFTKGAETATDLYALAGLYLRHTCVKVSASNPAGGKYTLLPGMSMKDGVEMWRELTDTAAEMLGPDHQRTIDNTLSLATMYDRSGDYLRAEACAKKALLAAETKNARPDKYSSYFSALTTLKEVYVDKGDQPNAELTLRRMINYLELCAPQDPFMACALEDYSKVLRAKAMTKEAKELEIRAAQIRQRTGAYKERISQALPQH